MKASFSDHPTFTFDKAYHSQTGHHSLSGQKPTFDCKELEKKSFWETGEDHDHRVS